MLQKLKLATAAAALSLVLFPLPAFANSPFRLSESFNHKFHETWNFLNFEDDHGLFGRHPGLQCGTDACASLEKVRPDKFLRIAVNPSTAAGIYTNTDVSEVDLSAPDAFESGRWNPEVNRPVVMETRVRWNDAYNYDGSGAAVGTSGVVLWNSAVSPSGPTPQYDQIGFSWTNHRALGGFLAGFTAEAVVNLQPLFVTRPTTPLNLQEWQELKMVWSVNESGQQHLDYLVDDEIIGSYDLPEALRNLSVEMWNDNQEPTFTQTGIVTQYPSPSVTQAFEVDYIRVYQDHD